jgi:hypothetical protein
METSKATDEKSHLALREGREVAGEVEEYPLALGW